MCSERDGLDRIASTSTKRLMRDEYFDLYQEARSTEILEAALLRSLKNLVWLAQSAGRGEIVTAVVT